MRVSINAFVVGVCVASVEQPLHNQPQELINSVIPANAGIHGRLMTSDSAEDATDQNGPKFEAQLTV